MGLDGPVGPVGETVMRGPARASAIAVPPWPGSRTALATLTLALGLVLLSTLQLTWRLGLPTDGWQAAVGAEDLIYERDFLSEAEAPRGAFLDRMLDGLRSRDSDADRSDPQDASDPADLLESSDLVSGDRVLAVGDQDLRGGENLAFQRELRRPDGWRVGGRVPYTVERAGRQVELTVPIRAWTALAVARNAFDELILGAALPAWLIAFYLFARRPGNTSARLLLLLTSASLASSISWIGGPGGLSELLSGRGLTFAYLFFSHLTHPLLISPLTLLLVMGFPEPNPLLARWPRLLPALVLLPPWLMLPAMIVPAWPAPFFQWVLLCSLLQIVFLVWALLRVREAEARAQLRWFALGFSATALGTIVSILAFMGFAQPPPLDWLPGSLLMTLALTVALLRHRLFDIDVVVSREILEDLRRQAGLAAGALRQTGELQRLNAELSLTRESLVSAREEERRRLRRDLHDGLGPTLASLGLRLEAARNLLRRDPERADALLAETAEQMYEAIADIRRLVYELRPPALDELGLEGALRQLALRQAGTRVRVETESALPALPAAVEVAAYRIVQEALSNAVRHGQARDCAIRLALRDGGLELSILDDGRGLPEAIVAGVGLRSMRERAAELGGSLALSRPENGGTEARARLPLGPAWTAEGGLAP
jgi:signal transduction histidine kinase